MVLCASVLTFFMAVIPEPVLQVQESTLHILSRILIPYNIGISPYVCHTALDAVSILHFSSLDYPVKQDNDMFGAVFPEPVLRSLGIGGKAGI